MIMGEEAIWIVVIVVFISCLYGFFNLNNKIDSVEVGLKKKIDDGDNTFINTVKESAKRIDKIDSCLTDLMSSLVGDQLELFIIYEGVRDLHSINDELTKIRRSCGFETANNLTNQILGNQTEIKNMLYKAEMIRERNRK